jgi:hypothetical protein
MALLQELHLILVPVAIKRNIRIKLGYLWFKKCEEEWERVITIRRKSGVA